MIQLHLADCREAMATMGENSVDSIVTDPPYGLGFMGKDWDHGVPGVEFWIAALRVLKPGGHLLAFGGTRMFHRLACAIEDAGFEIRDTVMWVYGSGFPKSLDVSKAIDKAAGAEREVIGFDASRVRPNRVGKVMGEKDYDRSDNGATLTAPTTDAAKQWQGWGTALKPAWEPIIVARKPLSGTVAQNVLQWGTGGLNIDGCRIELDGDYKSKPNGRPSQTGLSDNYDPSKANQPDTVGRWPANLIHDGSDEVLAAFPEAPGQMADAGGAARFFYCAKASRKDRGEFNKHPTVKPTELMRYLCRLVTPQGGTVLDSFMGSGSTGKAAVLEGFSFIGCEKDHESFVTAERRIDEVALEVLFK